jgi:hypothetical protein
LGAALTFLSRFPDLPRLEGAAEKLLLLSLGLHFLFRNFPFDCFFLGHGGFSLA